MPALQMSRHAGRSPKQAELGVRQRRVDGDASNLSNFWLFDAIVKRTQGRARRDHRTLKRRRAPTLASDRNPPGRQRR